MRYPGSSPINGAYRQVQKPAMLTIMQFKHYAKILCLLFTILSQQIFAWGDVGHEVVAEIAWTTMNVKTKTRVQQLLNLYSPFYPGASSIAVAARWMDDIKIGLNAFDNWHYVNINLNKVGADYKGFPKPPNVVWALCQSAKTLKGNKRDRRPDTAKDFEKAAMLRIFLHLVGDIHQPLHCNSLRNKQFRSGDMGGNRYLIKVQHKLSNLHLYWDLGLGQFGDVHAPYRPVPIKSDKTDFLVASIIKEFPAQILKARIQELDFRAWAVASAKLAQTHARTLPPKSRPSAKYLSENQKLVREQVALAGYRLAYLLDRLLDDSISVNLPAC